MSIQEHNIFISHHGKDDEHVQTLKSMLKEKGYGVRNFSIDSTKHKDGREPSEAVVRRLLKMRLNRSKTVVLLIGPETYKRPWVNWEIEEAIKLGKRVIGIYTKGTKTKDPPVPSAFEKLGAPSIGWYSIDKLGEIIDGNNFPSEYPDGSKRPPIHNYPVIKC